MEDRRNITDIIITIILNTIVFSTTRPGIFTMSAILSSTLIIFLECSVG